MNIETAIPVLLLPLWRPNTARSREMLDGERNINIANLLGIAKALGVSLSELPQKVD